MAAIDCLACLRCSTDGHVGIEQVRHLSHRCRRELLRVALQCQQGGVEAKPDEGVPVSRRISGSRRGTLCVWKAELAQLQRGCFREIHTLYFLFLLSYFGCSTLIAHGLESEPFRVNGRATQGRGEAAIRRSSPPLPPSPAELY